MAERAPAVIVTGAAGGIGRALCDIYLARGATVIALDLNVAPLEGLGGKLIARALDITDRKAVLKTVPQLIEQAGGADIVINNAGITALDAFADIDPAAIDRVMAVNFAGAVNITAATLRAVRAARGIHVAISSVAGFSPLKRRTAYAASKHAMTGFFASLREEERDHGVAVLIACPSFVNTNPGSSRQANGTHRPGAATDARDAMTAAEAARIIVRAIDRRRETVLVGRVARLAYWLNRLSPRLYAALMRRSVTTGQ